jgi:hypothetical protein
VFTCFDALTPSDGDWAKLEKNQGVSLQRLHVLTRRKLRLKGVFAQPEKGGCQSRVYVY